jgi:Holliday junction DNA helicase RuvA
VIGALRGVVVDRLPAAAGQGELLVEVAGVGYRVTVPAAALARAHVGEPIFLHVHTYVREDALVLYGFDVREERTCFEALIGAHGVGPALALALLSVLSPPDLRRAVASGDPDALTAVPGVGKKTAARLLVELRARLDVPEGDVVAAAEGDGGVRAQARAALSGLGYSAEEATQALADVAVDATVEDVVRDALRRLARGGRPRVGARTDGAGP